MNLKEFQKQIEEHSAWKGDLDREKAEKALEGQREGTYLFRKADRLVKDSCYHFIQENHLEMIPYLLTLVESEEKVVDILLLATEKGWVIYHDDPDLFSEKIYHFRKSLSELLSLDLKNSASFPSR